ncbi:MAG: cupin domain-containing protein [Halochromatium sp.]
MQIEHWHADRDGPLNELALRHKLERRGYRITRAVYSPGMFFPAHAHAEDKIDAVLSGRFRVTMQGQESVLEAGDLVVVPKHVMHTAEVVGEEPVVSLDGVRDEP